MPDAMIVQNAAMNAGTAVRGAGWFLLLAGYLGALAALLVAAVALFSLSIEYSSPLDRTGIGWVVGPLALSTPVLFVFAMMRACKAIRDTDRKRLLEALWLCLAAAALIVLYVRYDPLLKIDSCLDAGGIWKDGACVR